MPFGSAEQAAGLTRDAESTCERVRASSHSPFGTAESSAPAEVAAKLAQVRALLAELGAPAIVLTTAGAVAWLTAGLDESHRGGLQRERDVGRRHARRRARADHQRRAPAHRRRARPDRPWPLARDDRVVRGRRRIRGGRARVRRRTRAASLASDGHPGFGIDADDALAACASRLLPAEQRAPLGACRRRRRGARGGAARLAARRARRRHSGAHRGASSSASARSAPA